MDNYIHQYIYEPREGPVEIQYRDGVRGQLSFGKKLLRFAGARHEGAVSGAGDRPLRRMPPGGHR